MELMYGCIKPHNKFPSLKKVPFFWIDLVPKFCLPVENLASNFLLTVLQSRQCSKCICVQ